MQGDCASTAGANTRFPAAAIRARTPDRPVGHGGCSNLLLSSGATTLHRGSSWHSGASVHKPGSEDWFRYEEAPFYTACRIGVEPESRTACLALSSPLPEPVPEEFSYRLWPTPSRQAPFTSARVARG